MLRGVSGSVARLAATAAVLSATALAAAGCASGPASPGDAEGGADSGGSAAASPESAEGTGGTGSGASDVLAACEAVPTGGFGLHSDPAMTLVPEPGAVFGDGSTLAFQYTAEGLDPYATFGYDLAYIQDDGNAIVMGGAPFFEADTSTGTFSTSDAVFDSNADGRPGIMTITVTSDGSIGDDGAMTATTVELGQYCLTLAVE